MFGSVSLVPFLLVKAFKILLKQAFSACQSHRWTTAKNYKACFQLVQSNFHHCINN